MSLMTFSSTNPSTASSDRRGLTAAWRPRLEKKKYEWDREVMDSEMMVKIGIEGKEKVKVRGKMVVEEKKRVRQLEES